MREKDPLIVGPAKNEMLNRVLNQELKEARATTAYQAVLEPGLLPSPNLH